MAETSNGADAVDPYVEKIEAAAEAFSPIVKALAGDLRDFMLDLVRTLPKTWAQMSENEQTARSHAISNACRKVVREGVSLLETDERTTIEVGLEEVNFKTKGITAKLGVHAFEPWIRHALVDAQGKDILIVVADAAQYMGERAPARVDKQQPDLPLVGDAEKKVDAELDTIIAGDDTGPKPGQIGHLTKEREAAAEDPFAAGKAAGILGYNETADPFPHPSVESADWLRGHSEGEQERLTALADNKRHRRRRNGPDQEASA